VPGRQIFTILNCQTQDNETMNRRAMADITSFFMTVVFVDLPIRRITVQVVTEKS
jgi:hypothetical protein